MIKKTAHRLLAEAVKAHLESDNEDAAMMTATALADAHQGYLIAEAAALGAPLASLISTAVKAIDAGDLEAAKACLNTIGMASEFTPLVDVKEVTAPAPRDVIQLTPAEISSGTDRVRWAELLIKQLPEDHDGRNSWLMNFGRDRDAVNVREGHFAIHGLTDIKVRQNEDGSVDVDGPRPGVDAGEG